MNRYIDNGDGPYNNYGDNDDLHEMNNNSGSENYKDDLQTIPYLILSGICIYFSYHIYMACRGPRNNNNNNVNEVLIQENIIKEKEKNINEIKKINGTYQNILEFLKSSNSTSCVICFEDYKKEDKIVLLKCSHIYHEKCITDWLNNDISCPLCRRSDLL